MQHLIAVALGGALGAVCRHAVSVACVGWMGAHAAFATLVVNVAGCLLMGVLAGAAVAPESLAQTALAGGFLGALTTFSAFGLDTARFLHAAEADWAILNVAGNVLLGVAAVLGGIRVGLWLAQ